MSRLGILSALLVLTLSLSLVSNADARRWRHSYGQGYSDRSGDDDGRRTRAADSAEDRRARTDGGTFGAVIDRLVRGCLQQAVELQSWRLEEIAQIVMPDDAQRGALEVLRGAIPVAAERLSAECPQDVPMAPGERLRAVEQAINVADAAFSTLEPAVRGFYAALDDEQKARLLLSRVQAQVRQGAERSRRRIRRSGERPQGAAGVNPWAGICEHLTAALRTWPIREVEHDVRLSEPQRVAFYELVTSSLRAAETLARDCPAATALTPVRRMATLRARLAAVRQATTAIHPTLTRFYEGLDEGQRARFAGMR